MKGSYVFPGSKRSCFRAGEVRRVPKVWGEEQWIVNKEYCGKKLLLKKNHRCSMHHHDRKDEVFYIQSGRVLLELKGSEYTLNPGDFVHIRAGEPHRFTGLLTSEIFEFSTTHDESDSYRTEFSGHVDQERYDREAAIIRSFPRGKVLVFGDAMLDTYVSGSVSRISPEAPIPVMQFQGRRYVPGGAANAAANIASLGGRVTLLGVRGKDDAGRMLESLLKKRGVTSRLINADDRCTTEKQRVVAGDSHQLVRVDYETAQPVAAAITKRLLSLLRRELKRHHVLLLSDYAKGLFRPQVLRTCIREAKRAGVPVILDPKPQGARYLDDVRGVTLLTPNRHEACLLAGAHSGSIQQVALSIARAIGSSVLCTLGADGMVLALPRGTVESFPALARGVVDVSGAGDTVAATLALALAAGATLVDAVDLSNRAASIVVEKAGTTTVSPEELKGVL